MVCEDGGEKDVMTLSTLGIKVSESNDLKARVAYKSVIEKIKQIYHLFSCLTGKISEYPAYIKYPEFLLDDFFYHLRNVSSNVSIENLENFCYVYEYFTNTIINRMDEYQFDINTWENDMEWKTPRILYLLDKCLDGTHMIL